MALPQIDSTAIERALPALGSVEYVDSGGWKHVYKFHHGASDYALMVVPMPTIDECREELELDNIIAQFKARIRRETKVLAETHHSMLVKLGPLNDLEVGYNEANIGGRPILWFTEQFVAGTSMYSFLRNGNTATATELAQFLQSFIELLDEFRSLHFVHRDIKPKNLMCTGARTNKTHTLLDAGIALDSFATALTPAGMKLGTTRYMSPEQVKGEPLDWRSDLFSVGVTAFEYATRRHPFAEQGTTPTEIESRILMNTPESLASLRPDIDPTLCKLIGSFLRKKPHLRPGNIEQILKVLSNVEKGGGEQ
ncbi:MAG: serine/threonine protein kinase [Calditrichaeota bacterium]|nr:serine/threonine protein kinase [Calditrichota bacterium]